MNRRDFMKLAGLGIASVAVPKAVIDSISPERTWQVSSDPACPSCEDKSVGGFLVPFEYTEKLSNLLGESGEYTTVTIKGSMWGADKEWPSISVKV